ncbi:Aspartic proteinase-like protein 2 [Zea mays]|uniref:Pepsin A n=2 Tax=Zea mays TaxID=4577 RepID=B6U0A1_MAIZE|nr:pepsin A [Zea mays]PWZ25835.1 Aspartic proteinase-like protein 2 [Zea mays]|eukprot:NP_001151415.1 pepsin A precursor [Zea mays]
MAAVPRASSFFSMLLVLLSLLSVERAAATGLFQVRRKFPRHGGGDVVEHRLAALLRHDMGRNGRLLGAVDLPLGGVGLPTATGLYYTRIEIGSPPKGYYVQVDTGSDILWVNGISCDGCPTRSGLGIELTQYDPAGSGTTVGCEQEFCVANSAASGVPPACPSAASPCQFRITYGDGSSTTGFYVTDFVQYNQVSGNGQTTPSNVSITFGCGAQLGGDLGSSSQALDGILGFGQSDASMLSQLAAARKVRKIFAHCLDTVRGGGIFAIGNVVQPPIVKTTPLVPNATHYNVNLQGISVGGATLQLPTSTFDSGDSKGTIIDSGTTLAYLPREVYRTLLTAVFDKHPDLAVRNYEDFICFQFSGSLDEEFPVITFSFEGDLTLNVYPHDYLFQNGNDLYCMGFLDGGVQTKDGKDMVLLGDLVLSNKLVVYDLEKQVIGWTDYNCSSSIKIEDDKTGSVYTVDAQNISAGRRFQWHKSLILLLVTSIWSCLML